MRLVVCLMVLDHGSIHGLTPTGFVMNRLVDWGTAYNDVGIEYLLIELTE